MALHVALHSCATQKTSVISRESDAEAGRCEPGPLRARHRLPPQPGIGFRLSPASASASAMTPTVRLSLNCCRSSPPRNASRRPRRRASPLCPTKGRAPPSWWRGCKRSGQSPGADVEGRLVDEQHLDAAGRGAGSSRATVRPLPKLTSPVVPIASLWASRLESSAFACGWRS